MYFLDMINVLEMIPVMKVTVYAADTNIVIVTTEHKERKKVILTKLSSQLLNTYSVIAIVD